MKLIYNFLVGVMATLAFLVGAEPSHAVDVLISPGYISGTVAMGDFTTYSISTNAVGGGYRSSKSTANNADYQLTVQGGDWDYSVTASAAVRGGNANTSVSFNTRVFPVGPGETVTNDYDYNVGVIRFHVNITGDAYRFWRGSSSASKTMPAGQEKTSSSAHTISYIYTNDIWEMPVVANQQVPVTASVYVYDPVYSGRNYTYNFGKMDIEPGQVIDIQIDIDYVNTVKPPPGTGGTTNTYEYGYAEGSVLLNYLAPEDFLYHYTTYTGYLYENPGFYSHKFSLLNGTPRTYSFRPRTNFPGGNFSWPYLDGNAANNNVRIAPDETTIKDFVLDSGVMAGKLMFSGTVRNEDLTQLGMQITGSRYYTAGSGWTNTASYGGSLSYTKTGPNMNEDYRVILSEGPWQPYYFSAYKKQKEYNGSSYAYIYDYNYYYDGNSHKFGHPVDILAGETTEKDFDYCVGSIIFRFRDASGAMMRNPYVYGNATIRNTANQVEMTVTNQGNNSQGYLVRPEAELFGPPADYSITNMRVYAADGSLIYFPTIQQEIKCNVKKYIDIPGPDIEVTAPQNELVTNSASIAVVGTAGGVSPITDVTINDQQVPYFSTYNPTDANEVAFDYDLILADGINTIITTATDATGAQASDERKVYVDRWQPEVSISAPTAGQLIWFEDGVTAAVSASDRGYGYTLSVYLDGQIIQQVTGTPDDTAASIVNYAADLGVLAVGDHTLSAEVVDRAGNSASATTTFTVFMDRWDPTVEIVTPTDSDLFVGCGTAIPLLVNAADQGNGFTLTVSLDGVEIGQLEGGGNLDEPVAIAFENALENLGDGSHTIKAVATDLAGNSAEATTTFAAYEDCYPPTVEIASPLAGDIFVGCGNAIPLLVNSADQGQGFTLSVSLDNNEIYQFTGGGNPDEPVAIVLDKALENLSNGDHTIKAVTTDLAGNSAEASTTFTAYADCFPPTVAISSPVDGAFYAAGIDEIPLNVVAADQGAGFDLTVYFDGQLIHAASGPLSLDAPVTINFSDLLGPLAVGSHSVQAVVKDLAGNSATAKATITAYQQAQVVVKPESRNNKTNGVMTIFVQLPDGLTANASLALADTAEISAEPAQQPTDIRLADDGSKLILKFARTSELMADQIFTVQGRYYPNPGNHDEWYYWRGSDTTKK